MDVVIAFVVAFVMSFIGSVLLGLVNVAVIDTAITKSRKSALWLAFGGVLPEIPYTIIAIVGTSYVELLKQYQMYIGIGIGCVLIAMGLSYMLKKKTETKKTNVVTETGAFSYFSKGFLLALANPQLIFYWSTTLIVLQADSFNLNPNGSGLIDFNSNLFFISPTWSFAIGAAAGAFLILYIYTRLAGLYKNRLLKLLGDKMGTVVGIIFIVLGLVAIVKNVI